MNKSTHIISILLRTFLFFFSCQAAKVKNDKDNEKTESISKISIKSIPLEEVPYEKWYKGSKVVYSPVLSENKDYE